MNPSIIIAARVSGYICSVPAKMEYLADIIWLHTRTRTLVRTQEIDHNLLCQPHNKTISELNGAGGEG